MKSRQAIEPALIRRINLRETRSSRAALSITAAAVLLVTVLWLAVELVLSATGQAALLISPAELARSTASLATATVPGVLMGAGAVLVLMGIALLAASLLPGNKQRHIVDDPRAAIVVDSEVLAASASRTARTAAGLAPEQVSSTVGRKRIDVVVIPSAGRAVDADGIKAAVESEISGYGLRRPLAVGVSTSTRAAVGA
ncbi:hypothetical protein AAGW05_12520 [Arthrobacter sp. LAPM80]|uniref:hypothetical protein n=1 Tax=Arthrobacter sp. LAPM80 TaxID=3141788 RepID=UPI00398AB1DD